MYLIREVFTAKPGHASKLAKLFKATFPKEVRGRVMTDMVGPYNTVVMEMEVESLAEWEKQMTEMRSGKPDPNMDPKLADEMKHYTDMYTKGRREIFQIV